SKRGRVLLNKFRPDLRRNSVSSDHWKEEQACFCKFKIVHCVQLRDEANNSYQQWLRKFILPSGSSFHKQATDSIHFKENKRKIIIISLLNLPTLNTNSFIRSTITRPNMN
ncbi:hypothetical protein Tsp_11785, partial [Trichinella spiralis]|uniref:hypothetical protein n=1 Tax=Trichinella spiralis TaxID=6334 RepID=UPI0001EFEC2F